MESFDFKVSIIQRGGHLLVRVLEQSHRFTTDIKTKDQVESFRIKSRSNPAFSSGNLYLRGIDRTRSLRNIEIPIDHYNISSLVDMLEKQIPLVGNYKCEHYDVGGVLVFTAKKIVE